jgi:hypothetical protein
MRLGLSLALVSIASTASASDWTPMGSMTRPRLFHTATTLSGDRVLVAGGCVTETTQGACAVRTDETEIFDLGMQGFIAGPKMSQVRMHHTATALASGDVLIVGGCTTITNPNWGVPPRQGCTLTGRAVDLYDAVNKTISAVQPGLVTARTAHAATLLLDGRVLVTGGFGDPIQIKDSYFEANALATAEIYDPTNRTFSPTNGTMIQARGAHTATLLVTGPNAGKVLITGGTTKAAEMAPRLDTTELFDPATGTFSAGPKLSSSRVSHVAVRLGDGRVIITTGSLTSATDLYDPAKPTQMLAGPTQLNGPHDNAAFLGAPVDEVLFAGDVPPELYDPLANTGRSTGNLTLPFSPEIALLSKGRALVVGGQHNGIDPPVKLAFVFGLAEPGDTCSADTDCRLVSCIDGVCCKQGCNVPCGSCSAPTGDCTKVTNRDHPTCTGTDPADLRTCDGNGACKKKQGVACASPDLCITGFCADGFCCESSCSESCVACDFPRPGRCVTVGPQPVNGRAKCPSGQFCSGSGPDCVPAFCDGDHTLRRPRQPDVDCAPYRCTGTGLCYEKCSSVDQCSAPNVCDEAGHCVPSQGGDGGCALGGEGRSTFGAVLVALVALLRRRRRS